MVSWIFYANSHPWNELIRRKMDAAALLLLAKAAPQSIALDCMYVQVQLG